MLRCCSLISLFGLFHLLFSMKINYFNRVNVIIRFTSIKILTLYEQIIDSLIVNIDDDVFDNIDNYITRQHF